MPEKEHVCKLPKSMNFYDGANAEGCWLSDDGRTHTETVVGSSGVYLIVTDMETGEVVRDDAPGR